MGKINLMGLDSDEDDQNITEVNIFQFFVFLLYFCKLNYNIVKHKY